MNTHPLACFRCFARATAPIILGVAFTFCFTSAVAAPAAGNPPAQPLAEKAHKLPLEHAFVKETSGDNKGLYTLTLKNTSTAALKTGGTIEQSVTSHNRAKSVPLDSQVIEPGKTRKIEGLAAHDKVTITAEGFDPLELTVP